MKKKFSTCMIGYNKEQVDRYLNELISDYEEELRKKKDRIFELAEETRNLKLKNEELSQSIEQFTHQEKYISRALIVAEQRAQAIVEEGQRKSRAESEQIRLEKERWRKKFREVRHELLEFEKELVNIIERFRDEINYYAAKEISDIILVDGENGVIENKSEPDSLGSYERPSKEDETKIGSINETEEIINVGKNKVIA